MTTYLTKTQDGKTHHFRVTVKNNGLDIVSGVFYKQMEKYYEGYGDNLSATRRRDELVAEKIKEGFGVEDFMETPENTTNVYDKAKWHYDGEFPDGLDEFQGFIHTGMFLGWLIDNDLVSDEFKLDFEHEIQAFKDQHLTGAQIFASCCDGVLTLEDINETGNRFALHYFDFDNGNYLKDYEATLSRKLPSQYHVTDTWSNYLKLKPIIDKRFSEWKYGRSKKPFWKFW